MADETKLGVWNTVTISRVPGEPQKLLETATTLARDERHALMIATSALPPGTDMTYIEVLVRPF